MPNIFSLFAGQPKVSDYARTDRIAQYARFKRIYDGTLIREGQGKIQEVKRLVFNYAQPIANVSASFLAGKPLSFEHSGGQTLDDAMTQEMAAIWQRSGGGNKFLQAALLAGVQGDCALKIELVPGSSNAYRLRWLDASICFPEFDPHDCERLTGFVIAYEVQLPQGGTQAYIEVWRDGVVTTDIDGERITTESYDESRWGGGPPFVWIPNQSLLSETYGRSDLRCLVDLIERFDHTASKQDQIIDYYAKPSIVFKGVQKPASSSFDSRIGTAYFLADQADAYFLEWKGNAPAVGEDLERLRDAISEVSETPRIAFGKLDGGLSQLSGVALKVLYAPLIGKTLRKQTTYGPGLQRAMHIALAAQGMPVEPSALCVNWPDPLPGNTLEALQALQIKAGLGVSREQILREMDYTPEEIAQNEAEASRFPSPLH
jgi:hypothetical protein